MMQFIDYRKFEGEVAYVSLTYWKGDLNVWRVLGPESYDDVTRVWSKRVENVSDHRGLLHIVSKPAYMRPVTKDNAMEAMRIGLERARRQHRNAMRRTVRARKLGREHGKNAGSWVIDGNTSVETARNILDSLEEGTFWNYIDTDYSEADKMTEEQYDAYRVEYDSAYEEEVARAAREVVYVDDFNAVNGV